MKYIIYTMSITFLKTVGYSTEQQDSLSNLLLINEKETKGIYGTIYIEVKM